MIRKSSLSLILLTLFLVVSCDLTGAISPSLIPTPDTPKQDEETEDEKEPGNKEPDEEEPKLPELLSAIQVNPVQSHLFTYEDNLCQIQYPDYLQGELLINEMENCNVTVSADNSLLITPVTKGELSFKVNVGRYYNTFNFSAYDKLLFKVTAKYKGSALVPPTKVYRYGVFLSLENSNLPEQDDIFYIYCEYQKTDEKSDSYTIFQGKIGINQLLHLGTDTTSKVGTEVYFNYKTIRISGVQDKYTIAILDRPLVNHNGDPVIFEFINNE